MDNKNGYINDTKPTYKCWPKSTCSVIHHASSSCKETFKCHRTEGICVGVWIKIPPERGRQKGHSAHLSLTEKGVSCGFYGSFFSLCLQLVYLLNHPFIYPDFTWIYLFFRCILLIFFHFILLAFWYWFTFSFLKYYIHTFFRRIYIGVYLSLQIIFKSLTANL